MFLHVKMFLVIFGQPAPLGQGHNSLDVTVWSLWGRQSILAPSTCLRGWVLHKAPWAAPRCSWVGASHTAVGSLKSCNRNPNPLAGHRPLSRVSKESAWCCQMRPLCLCWSDALDIQMLENCTFNFGDAGFD